ncbi:MAG: carbon storage regulator [Legionellales bacterium RIFCSPHIGHO2_12_FULL_42_9]|nr:MAG: carbon storage regulator [Legionellales bacterium RIFCSPHIGHO2_12_FULL_42_9]
MEIITISFEEPIQINLNGEIISIVAFKTAERGNIKFGIEAPRSIKVNREEVVRALQKSQTTPKDT